MHPPDLEIMSQQESRAGPQPANQIDEWTAGQNGNPKTKESLHIPWYHCIIF